MTLGQGDERFRAASVSLGGLGVVTALTLRLRPAFSMVQHVHERVSLDAIARGCLHRAAHRGAVAPAAAPLPPDRTPASGDELQTEYFVPWEHASAAIATVTALGAHIRPVLLLTEIRAVAADRLWLSPFCGRDSLAIHFSGSSGFRVGETDRGAPLGEAAVTVQAHAMTWSPAVARGRRGRRRWR